MFSDTEYIIMKKILTDNEGNIPEDDERTFLNVKNEFKRLKVEGKRSDQQTSHYTQNGRRPFGYERPSRPQQKFVPSKTKPDLWRIARTDQSYKRRDARSQSSGGRRFQPNGQNQNLKQHFRKLQIQTR